MGTGTFLGVTGPQTEKKRGELDRNPLINKKMGRETRFELTTLYLGKVPVTVNVSCTASPSTNDTDSPSTNDTDSALFNGSR